MSVFDVDCGRAVSVWVRGVNKNTEWQRQCRRPVAELSASVDQVPPLPLAGLREPQEPEQERV